MTRLHIARDADAQIEAIDQWWQQNRSAAPDLFAQELADGLEKLRLRPRSAGRPYAKTGGPPIRRLQLPRSKYHVYFSYDAAADLVEVRAVWHGARRRGPVLP